jgi:broad specificity phosphatase PhoE
MDMTTKFILFRHGQTEWNVGERFRGHADLALNETGLNQARLIAARLGSEKPLAPHASAGVAAIYSSPLRRAMQTAQPLADALRIPVQPHEGLSDIDFGALEGMTVEDARQAFPEVIETWLTRPGHVKFPKGDSFKKMRTRIEAMLDEVSAKHDGQTIALVSHKVVCGALLCVVLGLEADALWRIQQDVACINRFERRDAGWVVTLVNDAHHLS